ncbi:hypothetical protein [Tychonema sp. LEGE 07203]|uniref:hypothetical protein n=1 Tax=Tychonema sp. LEGE 07203 TaxID=1828671 RepID=UPI001882247B|nr:hypothetical protein [Tychonema sp. LEGE 07203]MBE9095049.1 hypothetical protein [Tychonema sp. LEGE 07203]
MQAYKLRGKIDATGNLVVLEAVNMPPGDVEIIVWPVADAVVSSPELVVESQEANPKRKVKTKIKALQAWFENTQPVPPDFDAEEARWEALKEKHNL